MTQMKLVPDGARPRVSKQDWLDAALKLLRIGGIEAVRVERLSAELGVAKSGFYYHFRDRADLHNALLDHWRALDELPALRKSAIAGMSPAARLALIAEIVDRDDLSRYDFAIRQWARQDARVRRIWRAEMNYRIDLIRGLFAELGFTGDDLENRTRLFVAYAVSERDIFSELSAKDRVRLREMRLQLLLSR
ncbi:TetR/AcrR family transcriptional regulator [Tropicimonas sediminicola]|uniref:Transcriptional regulator, TetR family n=1 Tax=Tropicimonas sediminicola TaxID=1031541 RepID=A0A239FWR4_9RHOB|nr:TetR/AcrR family transcriptional regulator [Tropicimonas sediminicola]SNS60948.1 transcriptional regulator, TetR family [Tropicimonas sediminicola]